MSTHHPIYRYPFVSLFLLLIMSSGAMAVPGMINTQGSLSDNDGAPLDGIYTMIFSIHDAEAGGSMLWSSPTDPGSELEVEVVNGIYNVQLGKMAPLNTAIFADDDNLWLEVAIYNSAGSPPAWETLAPRQRLTSVAYAFKAGKAADADQLNGFDASEFAASAHSHDHGALGGLGDDDHPQYFHRSQHETITGRPSFLGGTSGSTPPFFVDSSQKVDNLNADSLDDLSESAFFRLNQDESVSGRPSFNGGTSGSTPPFYVDSTQKVSNLNADYVDGLSAGNFATSAHDHDTRYVNVTGDIMTGALEANHSPVKDFAVKGIGQYGPTNGYLGIQGVTGYDGVAEADWNGREIGVAGISVGSSANDNYGVAGLSNYSGIFGEATDLGTSTDSNYGGYFIAHHNYGQGIFARSEGSRGRGGVFEVDGQYAQGVHAKNSYDGGSTYAALATASTGVIGYSSSSSYGWVGAPNYGLYGQNGVTNGYGVYGTSYGSGGKGVYAIASAANGIGIYAQGGTSGYAADLRGKVKIRDRGTGATVMELGSGLDYAEGFDLSGGRQAKPGSVLIIDPDNPGHLKLSDTAYDTKVAGIAAGAGGLGSGVRLGAGQFDLDVALAGRVYCNVDATHAGVQIGDLLTTSDTSGYAMKVGEYTRSQGAILGKAMQGLEKGRKGQILVLVTLQ